METETLQEVANNSSMWDLLWSADTVTKVVLIGLILASVWSWAIIFEKIGNELGDFALNNFHAHIAGIEYSAKGEKKHLNLEESDFNYKDLLKAFKDFNIKGAIVCESPNIEDDAKLLKDYYLSLN